MARISLAAAAACAAALHSAAANDVWPMAAELNQGSASAVIDPAFRIACSSSSPGGCPDPLTAAFVRYNNLVFFAGQPSAPSGPTITYLQVSVQADEVLTLGVLENYTLTVPASGVAQLSAQNQWGALRGLETFSQLVAWNGQESGAASYAVGGLPISITDAPRFAWRGVLIDTSRHYLTVSAILSTLDAMSYNKMNRLHWHIVDDNSWPLQSTTYPNFTLGAYAPSAVYTHADVENIVQYAWERGISIVPEFDLPGHAAIWGKGYPDLMITCDNGQPLADPTPAGQMYATVEGLLKEFVPLFRTDFIHFGGDEVESLNCWAASPKVQAFAQSMGYGNNMDAVRNYFETTLQQIAGNMSLTTMFWEEVADKGYDIMPNTVIDIWLSDQELLSLIKAGHKVVESYGLYLDQQTPPFPTSYFWQDTLLGFRRHDPLAGQNVTQEEAARVLGLSASMWGEQVDSHNIYSRMWPRAIGAAERMWSPAEYTDESDIFTRVEKQRCSMVRRGIPCGPIRPADETGYCALPAASPLNHVHVDWSEHKA